MGVVVVVRLEFGLVGVVARLVMGFVGFVAGLLFGILGLWFFWLGSLGRLGCRFVFFGLRGFVGLVVCWLG